MLLASCQIERRHHLGGFYTHKIERRTPANSVKNDGVVNSGFTLIPSKIDKVSDVFIDNGLVPNEENLSCTDSSGGRFDLNEGSDMRKNDVSTEISSSCLKPEQNFNKAQVGKQILTREQNNKYASTQFDPEQKRILRIVGWILIGLGLVGVIWLLGLILIPIGVVMVILGWESKDEKKRSSKSNSPPQDLIDVVYLKNGSIIRGIIIEQVPNVSLKIQTSDGSIFFYKMDEIEKITKEKPLN